jgi:hypothetical protein
MRYFSPNQAIRGECGTKVTVLVAHPVRVGHEILPGGGASHIHVVGHAARPRRFA